MPEALTLPQPEATVVDPAALATDQAFTEAFDAKHPLFNAQVGVAYTPVLADDGKYVTLSNAAAIALTLPQDSDVAIPIGTSITFVQLGAGQVTVSAGAGATLNSPGPTNKFRTQYSMITAIKRAANTWIIAGDLAAS